MKKTEKQIVTESTIEPVVQRTYMTVEEQGKLKGYLRSWIDNVVIN